MVAESESLARTRQLQRMLKCSSLCKVCLQELKTGNQLQRQQLPSAQVKQNENPVQLGKAKCRLASKQILHFDITVGASSEMLLRWSLLMCINPGCSLTREIRVPCLPSQRNCRSSGLQPWKQCHYYSCAPNQAHHVTVWGYPRRNSGVTQCRTPPSSHEGRATT